MVDKKSELRLGFSQHVNFLLKSTDLLGLNLLDRIGFKKKGVDLIFEASGVKDRARHLRRQM